MRPQAKRPTSEILSRFHKTWKGETPSRLVQPRKRDSNMTIDEYLRQYGTHGTTFVVMELLNRSPDFPEGTYLADSIEQMMVDLQSALEAHYEAYGPRD